MIPLAKVAAKHLPKGFDVSQLENIDVDAFNERNEQMLNQKYRVERKQHMYHSSIFNEPGVLDQHFKDFKADTQAQKNVLMRTRILTKRIIDGEKLKAVFTGDAGAGKTMLAVCLLNNINENQDLNLTCLFISFPKLMDWERIKAGGTDQERVLRIESAIKKADVVVWDDLGSETAMQDFRAGQQNTEASEYTQKVLFNLADSRKDKVDVFTTNNTSSQLTQIYNPKLISRMLTKKPENIIKFDGPDQRMS